MRVLLSLCACGFEWFISQRESCIRRSRFSPEVVIMLTLLELCGTTERFHTLVLFPDGVQYYSSGIRQCAIRLASVDGHNIFNGVDGSRWEWADVFKLTTLQIYPMIVLLSDLHTYFQRSVSRFCNCLDRVER